jgi:hypothetical protein
VKSLAAASLLALLACSKRDDAAGAAPSPSTSAPMALASAAPATPKAPSAWAGKYAASASDFYVPDAAEYGGFKFRGEDAGDGLGDGSLRIGIDPVTRAVSGSVDGPLGAMSVVGLRDGDAVTFTVRPNELSDAAYFGTGTAKVVGGKLIGEMRLSRARANVIRVAAFSLEPA